MGNYFTPCTHAFPPSQRGEIAWEIAMLFPPQGHWTEEEYLALDTNHLVELVDGCIEVHPMHSLLHQRILSFLFRMLDAHVRGRGLGLVVFAPLPVRLGTNKYREPDLIFLRPERVQRGMAYPHGADLVMEVVGEGAENRKRDLETKPREYAAAGIAEYWIVDPQEQRIVVLVLDGNTYREHGVFGPGEVAQSLALPGFNIAVQDVFAAGQVEP